MKSVRLAFLLSLALHGLLFTADWTWTLPYCTSPLRVEPIQVTCGQPSVGHRSAGAAMQSSVSNSVSENAPVTDGALANLPEPISSEIPEMNRPTPPPVEKSIQPVLPEKRASRPEKTTPPETVKPKNRPHKPTEVKKAPQKKLRKAVAKKSLQKKPEKLNAPSTSSQKPPKKAPRKTVDPPGSTLNSSIKKTGTSAPAVPPDAKASDPGAGKGSASGSAMASTSQMGKIDGNSYRSALPLYEKNPPPRYPRRAKKRGVQGEVILEVTVSRNGTVSDCHVFRSSGHSSLDKAAMKAVKQWVFQPAIENGKAIAMNVHVPIRFELN